MDILELRNKKELTEEEALILDRLSMVIDPELGIDIVNLGLIYQATLQADGKLDVLMTLTTPMCPLVDHIVDDINFVFEEVPEVKEVDTEITFDPPWSLDKLSRYAKIALGVF